MKKQKSLFSKFAILLLFLLVGGSAMAQNTAWPYYNIELRNDSLLNSKEYQFDIYLTHTGNYTTPLNFELSGAQIGIYINDSTRNGGFIDSLVIGSTSDINSAQQQNQSNLQISNSNPKCIKITPKSAVAGSGTQISKTLGTRVMRVRLLDSIAFRQAKPNLIFVPDTTTGFNYPTKINAYIGTTSTNISVRTGSGYNKTNVYNYANPILNKPISFTSLTGTLSYCQGSSGTSLTFANSESGVRYHLIKNGVADTAVKTGTGAALVWNNLTAGTYTLGAHRIATYIDTIFTNSVIVTADLPTVAGSVTGGSTITLGNPTGTLTLGGYTGIIIKWQKRLDGGTWTDITNTLNTYSETPTPGTWDYRAVVKNGSCNTDSSGFTTVIVTTVITTQPILTTNTVTNTSSVSATLGGNISSNGGATVTASGVVYSLNPAPTVGGVGCTSITTSPTATIGTYSLNANGLTPCTLYSVRAWATNSQGTAYGNELNFLTSCTMVVYNLSGGGSYCAGGTGSSVTLSGSELGITYQLKKDGTATGAALNGTGAALTWNNLTAGTYTVTSNNGVNTTDMNGSIIVTVTALPTITATTPAARCGTGTLVLSATASAGTINWHDTLTAGNALGSGTSFTTPSIANTTNYYVDATYLGCTSTSRTLVVATINPIPVILTTTPGSRCGTGSVTLGATSTAGGTIDWWVVSTGGTLQGTGSPFNTPSLSSSLNYYVDVTLNGCTSSRTLVTATINPAPTITAVTASGPTAPVCDSAVYTLTATASSGTLNWYTVPTGGTSVGTGSPFSTGMLHAMTTYYVDATGTNSCVSARSSVVATIYATPTILSTVGGFVCGSGNVTMNATASAGTVKWYNVPTGGTSLAAGNTYTTSITGTTSYYVESNNFGCISESRTIVIAEARPMPTITATTGGSRCGTGTVSLSATGSAGIINWYLAATGGTSQGTGSPWTTPSMSATTTFYVGTTDSTCSSTRTAVIAQINAIPTVTGFTNGTACGGNAATVTATPSAGTINWYSAATGGTMLSAGTSYTTTVTTDTNFYAEAVNNGCTSGTRTIVHVTIAPAPTVTATVDSSRCGTGTVVLSATSSAGTVRWYSVATGGTVLGTGNTFTTPSISATTTYYAEAYNNPCSSLTRTIVTATVKPIPTIATTTPGSTCGAGTVILGATASAGTVNWYNAATGGTANANGTSWTTPVISSTTTYFVDATFNGCTTLTRTAVIASVNSTPTVTGNTPASVCAGSPVTLSATPSTGGTINWYAAATGGTSLYTGNSYTTTVATTTTFYVDASATSCPTSTPRVAVTATIKPVPTITNTTSTNTNCGPSTVAMTATPSGGTVTWYSVATGGINITTGTTYTTPVISTSATYYVDATLNGCTTTPRVAILAHIKPIPTITATTPGANCGTGTVVLAATPSSGTVSWYAAATGGASIGTGSPWTTPSIGATTTYYVDATDSGCTTATRTAVVATINALPTITATTPNSRCGTGTVVLNATGSTGTVNWYAAATGGTSLGTGTSFTTPSISATTTYYVDVTSAQGCTSTPRTAVVATINPIPTITATTPAANCGQGSLALSATASGGTISWYGVPTGGVVITTGNTYTTPTITSTLTYYVETTLNGCTSTPRVAVTATIHPIPVVTGALADTVCGPVSDTLSVTTSGGTVHWYAAATGGTALAAGSPYITPVLSNNTTYYVDATDSGCTSTPRLAILVKVDAVTVPGILTGGTSIHQNNFTGLLTLTNYTGSIVKWQNRYNYNPTWNNIVHTTDTLTDYLTALGAYEYRVFVKNGVCPVDTSVSDTVFVIIDGINETGKEAMLIYSYDKSIFIKNPTTENIQEVIVYNIAGQEIKRMVPVRNDLVQVDMNVATANYIVKVLTKKQAYSAKVFLR